MLLSRRIGACMHLSRDVCLESEADINVGAFVAFKMPRLIILTAVAALASSCGARDRNISIRGVDYSFSASDEPSVVKENTGSAGAFARVQPAGEPFHLIYSPRHYRPNLQGKNVPTIHWVNSGDADASVREIDGVVAVCRVTDPALHYTCGIQVIDAGLLWAAVFDSDRVSDAAKIHAKGVTLLKNYREEAQSRKVS